MVRKSAIRAKLLQMGEDAMDSLRGDLRKMAATVDTPVVYALPVGELRLPLNSALGKTLRIEAAGEIHCIACSRKTKKSFNQGYCYPCFRGLAQCDLCIVRPELCHFARGTCREPAWGLAQCMQPHCVYLANSSGLKVGITRRHQLLTRWMDQGAVQALSIFQVSSRYQAGLIEVALKQHVADRTDWRSMLKGEPEPLDMPRQRDTLLAQCGKDLPAEEGALIALEEERVQTLTYPVLEYPKRVTAFNFDKTALIEGTLLGIKGQYLILDTGVLNVRKFAGYQVTVTLLP